MGSRDDQPQERVGAVSRSTARRSVRLLFVVMLWLFWEGFVVEIVCA